MNLDFVVYGQFEQKRSSLEHKKIFKAILATLNDSRVNPIALFSEYSILEDRTLIYSFHPASDPVYFSLEENNILKINVNTGALGAGYHAFFIHILDRLSKRLNVEWKEDEKYFDITKYFIERDFSKLKLFFAKSLKNYSIDLINHYNKGFSNFMLSIPYGYPIIEKDFFALSSLGYWGKSFFMDIQASEDDEKLLILSSKFFIWENEEMDAFFWFKSALSMIWLYYPFRAPIDDLEKDLFRKILYSFEMAYSLNKELEYPWNIWLDIANYIDDEVMINEITIRKPKRIHNHVNEIGFRNEMGRNILVAGFSIVMPMSMTKYTNHKTLIEFKDDKLYSAFEVYSFEEEDTESIMEYVKRQIEDINDENTKIIDFKIENENFTTSLYEKNINEEDYMLILALSTSKLALLAWFTYNDISIKEHCISYLKTIKLEK